MIDLVVECVSMCVCVYECMCVCLYVFVCVCFCVCVCVYVCMCVYQLHNSSIMSVLRAVLFFRIEMSVTGYALYKSHIIIIIIIPSIWNINPFPVFSRTVRHRTGCAMAHSVAKRRQKVNSCV